MASQDRGGSTFVAFLLGAAAGAALGVLFAPRPGRETREQLADWLKDRREKGSELLTRVREESIARKDQVMNAVRGAKKAFGGRQEDLGERQEENIGA